MARGILVELLSRPDGWETTADEMWRASVKKLGKESPGRRAFRAAFAELKAQSYMVPERATLAGGRHGTVLTVHDLPVRTDVPHGGTSVSPADMDETAGGTDVPLSDVPHGGTSNRRRSTKTGKKTGGDGRRPTTGSGGPGVGGSAALADEHADEVEAAAIGCVIGLLPRQLRDQLPNPVPGTVVDAIRGELVRGIAVGDLVGRAERRWLEHGYESDAESADGPGILRPVGVAVALIRPGKCTSPRCDDGTDLDTGGVCRTCEREAEERRQAADRPVQGAFLTPVPSGGFEDEPTPHAPAQRSSRQRHPLVNCDGCDHAHRASTPGQLCLSCRVKQRAVSNA
ncbi:hypothetical protein [Streptomyces sp. NPDC086776]|uniref:hypothetical protein n=1 Tax=Streptomyces sp. NPDC086776 TaxID=3365756 RepID=UPI00380702B2